MSLMVLVFVGQGVVVSIGVLEWYVFKIALVFCYLVNLRAAFGAFSTFVISVAWFFVGLVGMWFRLHM